MNGRDKDGFTGLHLAAEGGHTGTVKALIERQAKVDVVTDVGFTPLNLASKSGCDAVVRVLLDNGASLETTDTAYGCTGGCTRVVLCRRIARHCATRARDCTLTYTLFAALLWAVQYCNADTVKRLVDAGAKTEVKSRWVPPQQRAFEGVGAARRCKKRGQQRAGASPALNAAVQGSSLRHPARCRPVAGPGRTCGLPPGCPRFRRSVLLPQPPPHGLPVCH